MNDNELDLLSKLIITSTPGGIEMQERGGQQVTVRLPILPRLITNPRAKEDSRSALERLGIVIEGEYDDLFYKVKLPDGWYKVAEGHHMWQRLEDEQGRERAVIFYKAAFYDRRAHIRVTCRYNFSVQPIGGWPENDEDYDDRAPRECVVTDGGQVIWRSEPMTPYEGQEGYEVSNLLEKIGQAWIESRYPNYRDPFAYWAETANP